MSSLALTSGWCYICTLYYTSNIKHDIWKEKEDSENVKETVAKFERRISAEVQRQEKLKMAKKRDFGRRKLLGKYIAKMLYRWNDGNFEEEYLKRLKRN